MSILPFFLRITGGPVRKRAEKPRSTTGRNIETRFPKTFSIGPARDPGRQWEFRAPAKVARRGPLLQRLFWNHWPAERAPVSESAQWQRSWTWNRAHQ